MSDLPSSSPQLRGGDDAPCTCPAMEMDEHTAKQHITCGKSNCGGDACGGCHDCAWFEPVHPEADFRWVANESARIARMRERQRLAPVATQV